MNTLRNHEFWFVVGSQQMYGPEVLAHVRQHAAAMVAELSQSADIPSPLILKKTATTSEEILSIFREANSDPHCAGIVTWMHTFSPSKMWIAGLSINHKPLLHLHTQYNRDIPWSTIDMDYMNLNQSAHGDREHGFIMTRMKVARKVVVGHWQDPEVQKQIGSWMRAACAFADGQSKGTVRFGDNMREVAVTDGNKVSAQIQFGWSVNTYALGDLVQEIGSVTEAATKSLLEEYRELFTFSNDVAENPALMAQVKEQAHMELGIRSFLDSHNAGSFTTTFENLVGLNQLPGLAAQHLMLQGYGFGAEGDWKTAALVRAMKVMGEGLKGGTSFMEDYTYNLEPGNEMVLGAHMLEVCPSIARAKPVIEVHPLSIGNKGDPARLVFDTQTGPALTTTMLDLGSKFRLLVNEVESVALPYPMPKLPVARALWKPYPSFKGALKLWILAGGAHHTGFSTQVTVEMLEDYARTAGVEFIEIGKNTNEHELSASLEREFLSPA
ncbi:MAG: L-arabinose isomerase [Spirochaetaceae bacterium]|nr:L-arabinose isomerase [Spirochaetaceae bacterium]